MKPTTEEIQRRTAIALLAIKQAWNETDADSSVTLFVSSHLEDDELEPAYWKQHTGTPQPTPKQVLDLLVLRSHWSDDEQGIDVFDFTLPGDVTQYVLGVIFDENGDVVDIVLES